MSLRLMLLVLVAALPWPAFACSPCRTIVFANVLDASFAGTLLVMVAPILLLVAIGVWIYRSPGAAHGGR